ncbi:hypothetical protein [Agrococcus sp. DT81.2]|uniref:hypothetical protein n=1 Tax=Agrococcus sp. DT81.2 TaxID=3393414 RepID=UPI003CE58D8D
MTEPIPAERLAEMRERARHESDADVLADDVPDLLAEVERLREQGEDLTATVATVEQKRREGMEGWRKCAAALHDVEDERDRAEAALARLTDDSMADHLTDALVMTRLSDHAGTDMRLINEAAGKVLAAIRAVAAGGEAQA